MAIPGAPGTGKDDNAAAHLPQGDKKRQKRGWLDGPQRAGLALEDSAVQLRALSYVHENVLRPPRSFASHNLLVANSFWDRVRPAEWGHSHACGSHRSSVL